ncbi:FAD-dependent oxidoreductase [Nocardioides convexus]|uniref:FAD-dependent oxidoreductase n=1 Tax=Nocardioides convexus TaxID=2712224 RepID=UPI0024182C9C|nr:FAD-dependent oxidoreductase [Nocardioides convexus]
MLGAGIVGLTVAEEPAPPWAHRVGGRPTPGPRGVVRRGGDAEPRRRGLVRRGGACSASGSPRWSLWPEPGRAARGGAVERGHPPGGPRRGRPPAGRAAGRAAEPARPGGRGAGPRRRAGGGAVPGSGGRWRAAARGGERRPAGGVCRAAGAGADGGGAGRCRRHRRGDRRAPARAVDRPGVRRAGEILRLRTDDPPLRTVRGWVAGEPLYLVPRGDGRVVLGATTERHDAPPVLTAGGTLRLLDAGRRLWPALDRAELVEGTARDRPATADGLPLVGPSGVAGVVLAAGHGRHGVLLAPLTARLVADHLETGRVDPVLDPRRAMEGAR